MCASCQEMKRVLFIFAKLNPGLRYVQGMNELLAPLYFHFRCDCDREAASHAEADAFFCFMDIISEFRDNFCQQLVRPALLPPSAAGLLHISNASDVNFVRATVLLLL